MHCARSRHEQSPLLRQVWRQIALKLHISQSLKLSSQSSTLALLQLWSFLHASLLSAPCRGQRVQGIAPERKQRARAQYHYGHVSLNTNKVWHITTTFQSPPKDVWRLEEKMPSTSVVSNLDKTNVLMGTTSFLKATSNWTVADIDNPLNIFHRFWFCKIVLMALQDPYQLPLLKYPDKDSKRKVTNDEQACIPVLFHEYGCEYRKMKTEEYYKYKISANHYFAFVYYMSFWFG